MLHLKSQLFRVFKLYSSIGKPGWIGILRVRALRPIADNPLKTNTLNEQIEPTNQP